MNVESIMTTKVVTIGLDDTLRKVDDIFQKHKMRHLPVLDKGVVVGIISDRDLLRSISPYVGTLSEDGRDRATLSFKAHQIMTRDPITVDRDLAVERAGRIMLTHNVSCLPVVDHEEKVIGIITKKDVLNFLLAQEEDED